MRRRPVNYNDWRELWNSTARDLGWCVHGRFIHQRSTTSRDIYKLIRRMDRIQNQLHAEFDGGTRGAMNALLHMIMNDKDNPKLKGK